MLKEELTKQIISIVDPDMSDTARKFYKEYFSEIEAGIGKGMRGETLVSLGWTFGSSNKQNDKRFEVKRSYTQLYTEKDIESFYIFKNRYHTLVNFCVWPAELNCWRGYFDGKNQGDYPDIFLELIRQYYVNSDMLPKHVFNKFNKFKHYFNMFGNGKTGWKKFIDYNYFRELCNSEYEVKDIFAPSEFYRTDKAPLVGTYHQYGENNVLPDSTEDPKQSSVNYMYNAFYIWDKRAEEMSVDKVVKVC